MNKHIAWLCLVGSLAGCGGRTTPQISGLDEQWDSRNRPEIFGLRSMRYEELANRPATRGTLDFRPWRDSYWPFQKRNVSYRYQEPDISASFASADQQIEDALWSPGHTGLS